MDNSTLNITGGMDVVGSDHEKVGEVADVQGDYVVVSKGFFFPKDYYIPTSAITSADGEKLYLNVTKEQALNQGWDTVPETTTTTIYEDQQVTDPGLPVQTGGAYSNSGGETPFEHEADTGHVEESDKIDVALTEEELTARKTPVQRGAVNIEKVVTEEEQSLDVPVTEERVNVSRRTVDRDVKAGDDSFEEGTIEVPLYGEDVVVEKRARVTEEVEINKDTVQDTQRATGTVRREDIRVTDETGAEIRDGDSSGGEKKSQK